MARTPTYIRVSGEELAGKNPLETRALITEKGGLLLIEDARRNATIPTEWMEVADKVILSGRVVKDRDGLVH